jgi:rhodanese-related sulfurtransferase
MKIQADCIALNVLQEMLADNKPIMIVDVRSSTEFIEQHIPNAIHIPLDELGEKTNTLDKNRIYITACGKGGGRSAEGAAKLKALGFDAHYLCGGTFGWF